MRKESTEYVYVPVSTTPAGVSLASDTLEISFALKGSDPVDWHPATYIAADTTNPIRLRILVGPLGGVSLAPGTYVVFARITDNPEVPVLAAPGTLVIEG